MTLSVIISLWLFILFISIAKLRVCLHSLVTATISLLINRIAFSTESGRNLEWFQGRIFWTHIFFAELPSLPPPSPRLEDTCWNINKFVVDKEVRKHKDGEKDVVWAMTRHSMTVELLHLRSLLNHRWIAWSSMNGIWHYLLRDDGWLSDKRLLSHSRLNKYMAVGISGVDIEHDKLCVEVWGSSQLDEIGEIGTIGCISGAFQYLLTNSPPSDS